MSVAVLLPLVFLVVQAVQVGWSQLHQLLFRSLTATLIWNTVSLVVVVIVLSVVVGTLAAWFVERTDMPYRRLLAILVVIPLGIPDFVVSFGWRAIFPSIAGFWAAVLVMTLAVYPLVFLPSPPACARRTRRRKRWPAVSGSAGCARSGSSPSAKPAWPSSGERSWSDSSSWPSSVPSRSSATRP